ncbi:hypothetical protein [Candidatus Glomeribacter gigasporarum]|uniref:hypothetical protein n=1 Tax=Candidatus Glomeribacter gigasporarum TaxID=132144 RepID=UPI0005B2DEF0|nr:hypothetical protein [Candidatus Glomeribacter gigasporarum]
MLRLSISAYAPPVWKRRGIGTVDFNTPQLQDHYVSVLKRIRKWIALLVGWLEDATSHNTPVGTKRWSEANQRFERFDGAVWQPLANQYCKVQLKNVPLVE